MEHRVKLGNARLAIQRFVGSKVRLTMLLRVMGSQINPLVCPLDRRLFGQQLAAACVGPARQVRLIRRAGV